MISLILSVPKIIALLIIKAYQKTLSLDHGIMGKVFPSMRMCKFTPSCSEYSYVSIQRFGLIKGGLMAVKRIVRCNPWNHPAYDPVPDNCMNKHQKASMGMNKN